MYRTKCYFRSPDFVFPPPRTNFYDGGFERATTMDKPGVPGLENFAAFYNGFWLNELFELVCHDDLDVKFWIPPSQILLIEKIWVEEEEGTDNGA